MSNISVTKVENWSKPVPLPDHASETFWNAAAQGRLLIQHCPACGNFQFYPRPHCTRCAGSPEWIEVTGRGHIYTFTVIRQNPDPTFKESLPYVVALIELDEGPRIMSNVTECAVEGIFIGMPVEAYVLAIAPGIGIPFWRPIPSAAPYHLETKEEVKQ